MDLMNYNFLSFKTYISESNDQKNEIKMKLLILIRKILYKVHQTILLNRFILDFLKS